MFWWLSFADGKLPEGEQFLGAAFVEAKDLSAAIKAAHIYGINPGGEIKSLGPLAPKSDSEKELWQKYRDRLLTREECYQFDKEMLKFE